MLLLLCAMVQTGLAYAPELIVHETFHDILDSTAFNVAMFAMGWAATKWASTLKGKSHESLFGLYWMKAMTNVPLALIPPRSPSADVANQLAPAADDVKICKNVGSTLETPLLSQENEDAATLLAGLSSLLAGRIALAETSEVMPPWRRSCFHSKETFTTQLSDYLAHMHWSFECSSPCLVIAMIYLDRLLSMGGSKITFTAETCHRLILTSLVAAIKFHDDDWAPYPNAFYAENGEIDVKDLNAMEKQLCKSIDWHFYVRPEEYIKYRDLITAAALTTSAV